MVHRPIGPLNQEVLEILSDGPRVLAPTHVDVLEVLLRDQTVALLGLLEELAPATGRLTKVIIYLILQNLKGPMSPLKTFKFSVPLRLI